MWHNHGHVVGIFPNFSEKSTKQCQTVNKKSIIMDVQKFIFLRNFCVKLNAMWTPSERLSNGYGFLRGWTGTIIHMDWLIVYVDLRFFTWMNGLFFSVFFQVQNLNKKCQKMFQRVFWLRSGIQISVPMHLDYSIQMGSNSPGQPFLPLGWKAEVLRTPHIAKDPTEISIFPVSPR